nr:ribonuclease H-like domain, reverse transcriptase, RNA-dependent DNA polymerase [Tanacetum cinerariifolium]
MKTQVGDQGACKLLGCLLDNFIEVLETVVATSSTEAEYVAAASYCAQVLWIQNQLLDYGIREAFYKVDLLQGIFLGSMEVPHSYNSLMYECQEDCLVGKGFSRVDTLLFDGMLLPQQVQDDVVDAAEDEDATNEISAEPTPPSPTPATTLPPQQEIILSPLQEDASKQGGIAKLDTDKDVTLEEADAEKDAGAQGEPAEVEEVLEVVTASKLMTKVVTTATTTFTAAPIPKASDPRKRRGVIIQDPEEAATASLNVVVIVVTIIGVVVVDIVGGVPSIIKLSFVIFAVMSSASSVVTYTSVYTDSEPGRVFWGADEELSDGGSPPTAPQDEDEHEPIFIQPHDPDFVSEPIYPEYIPLEDEHILPTEEQPLPHVDSPTAESPEYVAESDLAEDPKEYEDDETEDGLVDYPMDGGDDGDDDNGDSSGDDTDDEDEDEEDEEDEHLAPADSAVVIPTDELVSPPEGTEPVIPLPFTDTATTGAKITVRLQASISFPPEAEVERLLAMPTPSSSPLASLSPLSTRERLARCTALAVLPSPPLPPPLHMSPPVDRRDDIIDGFCPLCNSSNSCVHDPDPNSFDYPPDSYNPPHPTYETYSGDSCGNNSQLELFRDLFNDVQNIREELAEYINTLGWNRPAFYNSDDDDDEDCTIAITSNFLITDSLSMVDEHLDTIPEKESDEFNKSSVEDLVPNPKQAANARYWKIPACCDDDNDYDSVITPVLSTEETENSLSMGGEHLDTISAMKSDEVIKSSVEDLVPIPKKLEEDLVTYFQNFQNTSESSDDSTNVVNAPREQFAVKQNHGVNSAQNPPYIDECCYECGDALDGIFRQ